MPHYKDGSLAKVNDLARDLENKVVGIVAKITNEGDFCNAILAVDFFSVDIPGIYNPMVIAKFYRVTMLKECELVYRKAE